MKQERKLSSIESCGLNVKMKDEKNKKEQSLDELIDSETEKRLNEMEQPGYEFPARIGRADVAAIIGLVAVSLILIVLCMTGVIG